MFPTAQSGAEPSAATVALSYVSTSSESARLMWEVKHAYLHEGAHCTGDIVREPRFINRIGCHGTVDYVEVLERALIARPLNQIVSDVQMVLNLFDD